MNVTALLVVEVPQLTAIAELSDFLGFADQLSRKIPSASTVKRLGSTVFQFDTRSDVHILASCVEFCELLKRPYSVSFFVEPPVWSKRDSLASKGAK
jgi:hypothetical protein